MTRSLALLVTLVPLAHAKAQEGQAARPAEGVTLLEGFEAELLYKVPRDQEGSWVSIATGPDGVLFASDQGAKGIYRIRPAALGDPDGRTTAEKIGVSVSGAQGLLWAFDSLYANVNGQGVWRIRDTDGDGELDDAQNIIKLGQGGEHGPHAVLPTQDGEGLYFLGGNHTDPPKYDGSQAPDNWGEDLLLPRLWDARGHARGKLAPGGWIARCEPDGSNIQILSNGYRNQYDIALNPAGEMFTYDADMEWDHGTPWYRPTRVCHVTSGSEFGWRSGTGKWPAYFEDSLPPVVDIGPGSPVGIVFGDGAKFPARYQRALFILDWTFGTIYAVHLTPDGASYTGVKEDFAWGKPLAVTDAIVGADGALYFAVGGRGSQSELYRIHYSGADSTAPAPAVAADAGSRARSLRRSLEAFHGHEDPAAVEAAWQHLASQDRFVRFAARIAIENQPVGTWRERALAERDPQASVMALIALARQGEAGDLAGVVRSLNRLELDVLTRGQQLGALRAYALAFVRLGAPAEGMRADVLAQLDHLLPSGSQDVDAELVRVLTYLGSATVVPKTIALIEGRPDPVLPEWAELIQRNDGYGGPIAAMLANMPPTRSIYLAFLLRNATEGWTMPLRRSYFRFFVEASQHPGGMSYGGFLTNMRGDAEARLSAAEQRSLASLLGQSLVAPPPANITPPEGPGREWTQAGALASLGGELRGRSFERGKNLFHAAQCGACHRFAGEGGAIGPDLSTVANKFSVADILEAMVEPSKVISDQYASHIVADHDGRIAEGLVVDEEDRVVVYPADANAEPIVFAPQEIAARKPSSVSQMPAGLLNELNEEELRDLVAYLLSGGNQKAKVFQPAEAGGR
ncbi:MAG: c-type cytochrome [Planctomycetota bacterium]|nr:c-type cytochrome [Planctomycetota bacterium]